MFALPVAAGQARPSRTLTLQVHAAKSEKRGYKTNDGSLPPWKRFQKKGLGRQAEATLETIWERTQFPSDETIAGMWDLHRVRREQVITWFQERRKTERGGGKGSGGSGGSSSKEEVEVVDWDAEWEGGVSNGSSAAAVIENESKDD